MTLCEGVALGLSVSNSITDFENVVPIAQIMLQKCRTVYHKNSKFHISFHKWFSHRFMGGWQKHANHNTNPWEHVISYKISNRSEKSQTWCDDCLDHKHCSKTMSVAIATYLQEFNILALISQMGLYSNTAQFRNFQP